MVYFRPSPDGHSRSGLLGRIECSRQYTDGRPGKAGSGETRRNRPGTAVLRSFSFCGAGWRSVWNSGRNISARAGRGESRPGCIPRVPDPRAVQAGVSRGSFELDEHTAFQQSERHDQCGEFSRCNLGFAGSAAGALGASTDVVSSKCDLCHSIERLIQSTTCFGSRTPWPSLG